MFIPRQLSETLKKQLQLFPIISLTGPRQSGKTTLLSTYFRIINILISNDWITES